MSASPVVLMIADDRKRAGSLHRYSQKANLSLRCIETRDLTQSVVSTLQPALILMNLRQPTRESARVCQLLREDCSVPIIMIIEQLQEIDPSLELDAVDYVCRPCTPREIIARVRVMLQRTDGMRRLGVKHDVHVNQERHQISIHNDLLDLTPVEFRMMALLATSPGCVYTRRQLKRTIYLDGRVVSDRTVDSHVKNLRKKLRPAFGEEEVIHSIYGVGFKFE